MVLPDHQILVTHEVCATHLLSNNGIVGSYGFALPSVLISLQAR